MLTSILTQQMETVREYVVGSAKWTWAVFIHRYMRLTPMYFFLLMFFMHVFPALGEL
eukprot:SAG22_NODE_1483_length_4324_cov_14.395266_2_plen_57_part_00